MELESPLNFFYSKIPEVSYPELVEMLNLIFSQECSISKEVNWVVMVEESQTIRKANCAKPIKEGELCFECMDCGLMKENHILCEECFRKGNHFKHRIKFRNKIWGYCDCGDENMILKQGFCESHLTEKIDERALRKKVPKEIRKKLRDLLCRLWNEIMKNLEEEVQRSLTTIGYSFSENLKKLLHCVFECMNRMADDSYCVLMFLASFLIKPINLMKNGNINRKFFHICDKFEELQFEKEKKTCSCSLLDLLFKFNQVLTAKLRDELVNLIFKLSPSYSLKESVVFLLLKNVYFLLELRKIKNLGNEEVFKTSISELLKLNLFYLVDKELSKKFIRSEYFNRVLKKIEQEYELQQDHQSHDAISISIRNTLQYFIWKLINFQGVSLFENKNLLDDLIRIYLKIKKRTVFFDNAREISHLQTNYAFLLLMKKLIKLASEEEKLTEILNALFINYLPALYSSSLIENESLLRLLDDGKLHEDLHHLNNVSTKIFSLFGGFYLQKFGFNYNKLINFLGETIEKAGVDKAEFLKKLAAQAILSIYSKFLINSRPDSDSGNKFLTNNNFTISGLCFEAFERFTLKIIFLIPFKGSDFLLLICSTIKFHLDLHSLESEKLNHKNLSFVFELSMIMLNDSFSVINVLNSTKSLDFSLNPNYPVKDLEFILANLHILDPTFSALLIKKHVTKFKKKQIDVIIERIATYNKSSNLYELKNEYKECFDLNLFDENSKNYQNFYDLTKSMSKKGHSLLLGNREFKFYDNPLFQKTAKKLFNPEFLELLFSVPNLDVKKEEHDIVRKSLKILYILLQKTEQGSEECDQKIMLACLEKSEIKTKLENLRHRLENNADFCFAICKIIDLLDRLVISAKTNKKAIVFPSDNQGKSSNEARKMKILAEFKKKQMIFMEKMEEELPEKAEFQSKGLIDDEVCSFCLQNSSEKEDVLCLVAFLSADNIFKFLMAQDSKKFEAELSLVPCGHLVHRDCHLSKLKERKIPLVNNFFGSDMEFLCNYCKTISNLTVPLVDKHVKGKHSIDLNINEIKDQCLISPKIIKNQIKALKLEGTFDLKKKYVFEEFFDELCCATSYLEGSGFGSVFDILKTIVVNSLHRICYKDFFSFVTSELKLVRNLFNLTLYNLILNCRDEEASQAFISEIKFLIDLIQDVKNLIKDIKNIHYHFVKLLVLLRLILNSDENLLCQQINYVVKTLISHLMILCFKIYNPQNEQLNLIILKEFFSNQEIHSKAMTFLAPFYSTLIGFFLTCFDFDPSLLSPISMTKDLENSEIFKSFKEVLHPENSILAPIIEEWQNILFHLDAKSQQSFKEGLSELSRHTLRFDICEINCYDELVIEYFSRRCSICHFYPKKLGQKMYLCLVCNLLFCQGFCHKSIRSEGNLSTHARIIHQNKSVFLNMIDGSLLVMSFPLLIQEKSIFSDKHGQILRECDKKFNDFFVEKKRLNKWVNALIMRKLHQEIVNQINVDPKCWIENLNWKDF